MLRFSLPSLAILALSWQGVFATDLVYPNLPAASSPSAAASEAPANPQSQFAAQYSPLLPTMPPAPSATVPPAAPSTRLTTTMPQATGVMPAAVPAMALQPTYPVVPAAAPTLPVVEPILPAVAPVTSSPIMSGSSPIMSGSAIPTASPTMPSASPIMPVSNPVPAVQAPGQSPVPPVSTSTKPIQASPAPASLPVSKPTMPAALPPATSATPLPALMPPVKANTPAASTPANAGKTATPLAVSATTKTPVKNTPSPKVVTPQRPSFGSQVREFLGMEEAEEQQPPKVIKKEEIKKEVKPVPAVKPEPPKVIKTEQPKEIVTIVPPGVDTPCQKNDCTSCKKFGSDFCFGCWADEHLGCLRKQMDSCLKDCGCSNGLDGDIIAGVTFYWVQPNFEENSAFFIGNGNRGVGVDYRYHAELTPQIWIGYVSNSGLGGRITWWRYDRTSSTEAAVVPAGGFIDTPIDANLTPGESLITASNLTLEVWDFEVTQDMRIQQWVLLASGGLRYAYLNKEALWSINGGADSEYFRQTFNGAGPTVALAARRLLGDSGLALFGMTRAAVLFGSNNELYFSTDDGAFAAEFAEADILPVIELELGAEYGQAFGALRLFGQAGVVGQSWFGAGGTADSFHNMGFTGFFLRGGVGY